MQIENYIFILFLISIFSCVSEEKKEKKLIYKTNREIVLTNEKSDSSLRTKNENEDTLSTNNKIKFVENNFDSLYHLLAEAINKDSIDVQNWNPFFYLKTGYFLSENDKEALLIKCETNNGCILEYYKEEDKSWLKKSNLLIDDIRSIAFHVNFKDFNFDGYLDVYIQESASNGYVMSRGNLITINRENNQLFLHKESRNLANISVEEGTGMITSEILGHCENGNQEIICKEYYNWKDKKLIYHDLKCPKMYVTEYRDGEIFKENAPCQVKLHR